MRHKDAKADCLDNLKFVRESIRKIMDHRSMQGEDQVFNYGSLRALWHSLDIELNPKMRFLRFVGSFSNTNEKALEKQNTTKCFECGKFVSKKDIEACKRIEIVGLCSYCLKIFGHTENPNRWAAVRYIAAALKYRKNAKTS